MLLKNLLTGLQFRNIENRPMDMGRGEERVRCMERVTWKLTLPYVKQEFAIRSDQLLSHVRLCDPMNRSTPGLPVHHQLPEFTETRPSSQ